MQAAIAASKETAEQEMLRAAIAASLALVASTSPVLHGASSSSRRDSLSRSLARSLARARALSLSLSLSLSHCISKYINIY